MRKTNQEEVDDFFKDIEKQEDMEALTRLLLIIADKHKVDKYVVVDAIEQNIDANY